MQMKKTLFGLTMAAVFCTVSLSGAPVTSWRTAPDENGKIKIGGVRTAVASSSAVIKTVPASLSFRLCVREKVKSAWCTAGINIFISNKDWMQIALHDTRGARTLEITQVKDGKPVPPANLGKKEILKNTPWEYNTEYTVVADFQKDSMLLRMTDAEGKIVQEQKISVAELPVPLQGGRLTFRTCYAVAELGAVDLK